MFIKFRHGSRLTALFLLLLGSLAVSAQTEQDAIMMNKRQFCTGLMANFSTWEDYWEGTLKRNNENLGKVSNRSLTIGANYGITDDLNFMISVPHISTKASAGTLLGLDGIQDATLSVKWRGLNQKFGDSKLKIFLIGSLSTPLTDYVTDYQPLSIGLGTTNLSGKLMADYQYKKLSVTAWASYVRRSNIKIDRTSYYDTELRLTNEVKMPDAANFQFRAGYRGKYLLAEGVLTNWTTLGGFDITRNNMPFPSNRMNTTTAGVNIKYTIPSFVNLSLLVNASYTLAGRNMGQATSLGGGVFYAFYFKKVPASNSSSQNK
jgi:hypothetical protein